MLSQVKKIVSLLLSVVLGEFFLTSCAFAYQGPGTNGVGEPTNCSFTHAYTRVCGDVGGASWHVYNRSTFTPSKLGFNSGIMRDDKRGEISGTCASSTRWIAVYGWDGRTNGPGSSYVQYGPLNYPGQLITPRGNTYSIEYNSSRGAKAYSEITSSNIVEGMQLTEAAANNIYYNHEGRNLPSNRTVGYFCFDPDDIAPVYYAQSNASDGDNYKTSGISGSPKMAEDVVVNLEVGQTTSLVFSHNIFTSSPAHGVYFQIQKKVYIDDKNPPTPGMWIGNPSKYTFDVVSEPSYYDGGNIDMTDAVNINGTRYYTANNRPFSDGGTSFLFRDVFGTVKFKAEGKYRFCEKIYLNNDEYTGACVLVNVGPVSSYASKSNISNRASAEAENGDSDFVTTDIRNSETSVSTKDIKIKKGGKAAITFSHNIYSSSNQGKDTVFRIDRTVNDSPGISGDFDVDTTVNPSNRSSQQVSASYAGDAKFTNDKTGSYYVASPRPYTDGSNTFSLRDFYDITFMNDGNYNFCETVFIRTGYDSHGGEIWEQFTSACSRVIVGDGGDPIPTSNDCPAAWTPSSYVSSIGQSDNNNAEATTSVIAATRNNSVPAQSNWVKSTEQIVWAKPTDDIRWLHCYYPGVQKIYDFTSTKNNSHPEPPRLSGNVNTLNNVAFSSWGTWENGFRVDQRNMTNSNTKPFSPYYRNGDYAIKSWKDSYTVESGDRSRAGLTLTETAVPTSPAHVSVRNDGGHTWSCNRYRVCETSCDSEGKCSTSCWYEWETCEHSNDYYPSSRSWSNSDKDTATVKVPYNFETSSSIDITPTTNYDGIPSVYSGETVTITNMTINVGTRPNSVTNGNYATKVDNGRIKIIAYTSNRDDDSEHVNVGSYDSNLCKEIGVQITHGNCDIIDDKTRQFNDPENDGGHTDYDFEGAQYNVYDVAAGEYYCVAGAVYPYTVNGDTDMNASGSDTWYISKPSCVKIAKRPSFQVWGNSMYTSGEITTEPGTKRVIAGFHPFNSAYNGVSASSRENTTIFGSWVEQSLVTPFSSVSGLASGAATGYYASNPGVFKSRSDVSLLGGSHEGSGKSFCLRVPLTIPNTSCNGDTGIVSGNGSNSMSKPSDKSALVSRFSDSTSPNYTFRSDVRSLGDTVVPKGETWVYSSSEDFEINGNIVYESISYQNMVEIPKLIIHARNIKIDCKVKRVDAVLIADDNVKTCSGSSDSDDNAKDNASQLKVFGSVITNTLTLNRSYGAASGTYNYDEQMNNNNQRGNTSGQEQNYSITGGSAASVVPAEIVDYDTSLYLWGMPRANAGTSGKLDITYQTELAPRF